MSQMVEIIKGLSHRHAVWDVFSDFVELSAISLSNAVDKVQFETREARYFQIIDKYTKEELNNFPVLLGLLVNELEKGMSDVLGALFHELELHNKYKGQFFSPYPLCKMMAKMAYPLHIKENIAEKGFLTANEPCSGSGAMIIGLADVMHDDGLPYQEQLHVIATDCDIRCVHMTYVQLSLFHIPAVVIHGNTLTLEEFSHWKTPAHILGFWDSKLRKNSATSPQNQQQNVETEAPKENPEAVMSHMTGNQPDIQLNLF